MSPRSIGLSLALAAALALPAAAELVPKAPDPPPPGVKYKPGGGFTLYDGENFSLALTGRIQSRWTYINFDEERKKEDTSAFTAERIRFGAKGTMFKDWNFAVEADFGKGKSELKKGVIHWAKYKPFQVEMGQFNVKFDRSQFLSSGAQELVDRSIAAGAFGHEYDIGIGFLGSALDKKIQWNAGIFDGDKAPTPAVSNPNDGHLYVARMSFNPNGDFGLYESDPKKTDYHLWFIDVAGAWNQDQWKDANTNSLESPDELTDTSTYSFASGYRHAGLFISGEHYWRNATKDDDSTDIDGSGWYFQTGYTISRDGWEIALRHSEVDPDHDKDNDEIKEWTLGVNRFLHGVGHSLKLSGDITTTDEQKGVDNFDDLRLRFQAQVIF